jgi:hypothetical protein
MKYPNKEVPISELQLGDVVSVFTGPWGTATVSRIDDGNVYFYRPYGHASLSCRFAGNRLICYTGLEEFSRSITDTGTVYLYQRAEESDFEIAVKLGKKLRGERVA